MTTTSKNIVIKFPDHLGIPDFAELAQAIHVGTENLLAKAPSDTRFSLKVRRAKNGFVAALKLGSTSLQFSADSTARSPFVAVESVLAKAWQQVQHWSATKQP